MRKASASQLPDSCNELWIFHVRHLEESYPGRVTTLSFLIMQDYSDFWCRPTPRPKQQEEAKQTDLLDIGSSTTPL